MEFIIYALIFIMGTVFGSFITLAVYRIPLGLNITHEHSFCPKCNAKLKFKDLIPVLSYISLGGKCRYCGEKIRIRYLLIEVFFGIVFLLLAMSLRLDLYNLDIMQYIPFFFLVLYVMSLFIIAGIDKERISIQKSVLLFGLILAVCFMIYICISKQVEVIYTYIITLVLSILLLAIDTWLLKRKLHENYTISILILCLYMVVMTGGTAFYYTVAFFLVLIGINGLEEWLKNLSLKKLDTTTPAKEHKNDLKKKIPIGYYLIISNVISLLICNFLK